MTSIKTNDEGWGRAHYRLSSGQCSLGLDLYMRIDRPLTPKSEIVIRRVMAELEQELLAESSALHPENIRWKEDWLSKARYVFEQASLSPVYIREIDNEYCGPKCCPHRVWLLVTTRLGVIKFGWRKSVLVVDWSDSEVKAYASELFPDEDVTKGDKMIHAWGYDKATEYINALWFAWIASNK